MSVAKNQRQLEWVYWLRMAGGFLASASQMALQSREEENNQRALFDRVAGYPVYGSWIWRNSITWTGAALLALSTEQSLKAIAIFRGSKPLKVHNLKDLWGSVDQQDRDGVETELQRFRERSQPTKLGKWSLEGGAAAIVQLHKGTFETARYYLEDRPGQPPVELKHINELWQLAWSGFLYCQRTLPVPAGFAEENRAHVIETATWPRDSVPDR